MGLQYTHSTATPGNCFDFTCNHQTINPPTSDIRHPLIQSMSSQQPFYLQDTDDAPKTEMVVDEHGSKDRSTPEQVHVRKVQVGKVDIDPNISTSPARYMLVKFADSKRRIQTTRHSSLLGQGWIPLLLSTNKGLSTSCCMCHVIQTGITPLPPAHLAFLFLHTAILKKPSVIYPMITLVPSKNMRSIQRGRWCVRL
jgi:hypothetical protein